MPRGARKAPGGLIYHVLNRAVGRRLIFDAAADYAAFEKVLAEQHRHTLGEGHLYQGRFRSFPVQAEGLSTGGHLLSLCRYVELNPLRAKMVERAEGWRWSSVRLRAGLAATPPPIPWPDDLRPLAPTEWPVDAPAATSGWHS